MKERRSLVEGMRIDPELREAEEAFVFGTKRRQEANETVPESANNVEAIAEQEVKSPHVMPPGLSQQKILPQMEGRTPVTVRCRPVLASMLKRISLQRQLDGVTPYQVQEILEEAIINWMSQNGYNI